LRALRRLEVGILTALTAIVAGAVAQLAGGWWVAAAAVAVALVGGVVADLLVGRRIAAWSYAEREDDLLVQRGLLVRRLSVVPYGRMQFVDVVAGPLERSFGLATVRLHTAAAATDARIPGLAADEAARLRDTLASLGEARSAGL
jgi:membrane protein YdbS with pleckstrin-like domain